MALKNNFYNEIISKEEKWEELVNRNLLTSIYCKFELKPFYSKKKEELESELQSSNNPILGSMLSAIDDIIDKLDVFISQYEKSETIDFKTLLPLLLNNQMNNNKESKKSEIDILKQKRTELENIVAKYNRLRSNGNYDYVFDDFYEDDHKKVA